MLIIRKHKNFQSEDEGTAWSAEPSSLYIALHVHVCRSLSL